MIGRSDRQSLGKPVEQESCLHVLITIGLGAVKTELDIWMMKVFRESLMALRNREQIQQN